MQNKINCYHILIADDLLGVRKDHSKIIQDVCIEKKYNVEIHTASSKKKSIEIFDKYPICLALVDIQMETDMAGRELVEYIRIIRRNNLTKIILITTPAFQKEFDALTNRVYKCKYLDKSHFDAERLAGTAIACLGEYDEALEEIEKIEKLKQVEIQKYPLLGKSKIWTDNVINEIDRIAKHDSDVLIYGETGTGKENIARHLHWKSERWDKPFVKFQISSINEELQGSMAFGHKKGSFTNAYYNNLGFLEEANNGTLFLDEIGTLSIKSQILLLRALDEKKFNKIGGGEIKVNIRLITATNDNLEEMVEKGLFRGDFYYRIASSEIIMVPPLRERKEDISLIANYYFDELNGLEQNYKTGISDEAMKKLENHMWKGNVRELQGVVKRAFYTTDNKLITEKDIVFNKLFYGGSTYNYKDESRNEETKSSSNVSDSQLNNITVNDINELAERKLFIELNKSQKRDGSWNILAVAEDIYKLKIGKFRLKVINTFHIRLEDCGYDLKKVSEWANQRKIDDNNLVWLIETWLTFKFNSEWKTFSRIKFEDIFCIKFKISKHIVQEFIDYRIEKKKWSIAENLTK